jgi:signal transduction histidine kinase
MFPLPALVPICAALSAVLVGLLTFGFSRAPDGRALRWFTLVALGGGGFAAADVFMVVEGPDPLVAWMGALQLSFAALHGLAWMLHLAALEDRPLNRVERALVALCVALAAAGLIPGAMTRPTVGHHVVPLLRTRWADVEPTALGLVAYAFFAGGLVYIAAALFRMWRRGTPVAGVSFASAAALALCGTNDALVGAGLYPGPYLLSLGFFGSLSSVGVALVYRFVQLSRATQALSRELESKVIARTDELRRAQAALARSEKLAAIGQLAAGVAHEINNPAAVALGNLEFIREAVTQQGALPEDGLACVDDSIEALQRVARIVRQLLDTGRAAGSHRGELRSFALAPVVHGAVTMARPALRSLGVEVDVPAEVAALGDPGLLGQVLVNVIVNGAQATERAGRSAPLVVRAHLHSGGVTVHVIDAGDGMSEQTLSRLFEPFFTTRRGVGTGLGLAVSLGLMQVQSGGLEVVATGPQGTTMGLELPLGTLERAPALASPAAPEQEPQGPGLQPGPAEVGASLRF